MKTNNYLILGLTLLVMTTFYACKGGGESGSGTTASGIQYQIFGDNKGEKIKGGDFIDFHMVVKDGKDSTVQDTYKNPEGAYKNSPFPKDSTKGNIIEALMMLTEGDSAIFKISTDTMLAQRSKMAQDSIKSVKSQMEQQLAQAPDDSARNRIRQMYEGQIQMIEQQSSQPDPNLPKGKFITYIIKILAVKTEAEVKKGQEEEGKKREEEAAGRKGEQEKTIQEYLKKNKLESKTTESGLHYIITKEGDGEKPKAGDSVKVHYTGKLLDGKVFDTSVEAVAKANDLHNTQRDYKTPFSFPLGRRQVIPGWDEGISLLNKGSKASFVIPSHLAYGEQGIPNGPIPPNAILVFEVELLK